MMRSIFLLLLGFLIKSATAHAQSYTFSEVATLIAEQSRGMITLNPERSNVSTLEIARVGGTIQLEDLRFVLDATQNIFSPVSDIKIDAFNELMILNWKKFEEMGDQYPEYPKLSTWMGLPYPPLRKVPFEVVPSQTSKVFSDPSFHHRVDTLTGTTLTAGNQLRLMQDGISFQEKMRMLRDAKSFFWGSSLLFSCGTATDPMVDLMIKRKNEGIDIRLIVDATMDRFGHRACTERLRKAGIEVIRAKGFFLKRSAFHMKIWVRDGEEAIVDGANMIDSEVLSTGHNQLYHDTSIWIKGPSSTDLTHELVEVLKTFSKYNKDFKSVETKIHTLKSSEEQAGLRGAAHYDSWLKKSDGVCRVVTQSKSSDYYRISKTFDAYIQQAQESLYAATVEKEFLKTSQESKKWNHILLNHFIDKSKVAGFRAEIAMNAILHPFSAYTLPGSGLTGDAHSNILARFLLWKNDHAIPGILNRLQQFTENLPEHGSGLSLWSHYQYIHSKVLFLDESVVSVGSYNLFYERSNRDAEVTILCQDQGLNQQFKNAMVLDKLNSNAIH